MVHLVWEVCDTINFQCKLKMVDSSKSGPFFGNKSATTTPQTMSLRADNICQDYLCHKNALEGDQTAQEFLLSNAFSCLNFQKKISVADSMAEIFFSPENISIGIWKNRFQRNFGCTFFLWLL